MSLTGMTSVTSDSSVYPLAFSLSLKLTNPTQARKVADLFVTCSSSPSNSHSIQLRSKLDDITEINHSLSLSLYVCLSLSVSLSPSPSLFSQTTSRFLPNAAIETDAVLSLDEDTVLLTSEVRLWLCVHDVHVCVSRIQ